MDVVQNLIATEKMATENVTVSPFIVEIITIVAVVNIIVCVFGVFGNLFTMLILYMTKSSSNSTYWFMVNSLVTIDVLALTSMFIPMIIRMLWKDAMNNLWFCMASLCTRFFCFASGCVVLIMAINHWFMVTKPLFHRQYINLHLLKRMIYMLWLIMFCLAYAPLIGFGLYWDDEQTTKKCVRFRNAKKPIDVWYSYLILIISSIIYFITVISTCAAIISTYMKRSSLINHPRIRNKTRVVSPMLYMCIWYIVCWTPQMILIPLTVCTGDKYELVSSVAKLILSLNFVLNPIMYLTQYWTQVKSICLRSKVCNAEICSGDTSFK